MKRTVFLFLLAFLVASVSGAEAVKMAIDLKFKLLQLDVGALEEPESTVAFKGSVEVPDKYFTPYTNQELLDLVKPILMEAKRDIEAEMVALQQLHDYGLIKNRGQLETRTRALNAFYRARTQEAILKADETMNQAIAGRIKDEKTRKAWIKKKFLSIGNNAFSIASSSVTFADPTMVSGTMAVISILDSLRELILDIRALAIAEAKARQDLEKAIRKADAQVKKLKKGNPARIGWANVADALEEALVTHRQKLTKLKIKLNTASLALDDSFFDEAALKKHAQDDKSYRTIIDTRKKNLAKIDAMLLQAELGEQIQSRGSEFLINVRTEISLGELGSVNDILQGGLTIYGLITGDGKELTKFLSQTSLDWAKEVATVADIYYAADSLNDERKKIHRIFAAPERANPSTMEALPLAKVNLIGPALRRFTPDEASGVIVSAPSLLLTADLSVPAMTADWTQQTMAGQLGYKEKGLSKAFSGKNILHLEGGASLLADELTTAFQARSVTVVNLNQSAFAEYMRSPYRWDKEMRNRDAVMHVYKQNLATLSDALKKSPQPRGWSATHSKLAKAADALDRKYFVASAKASKSRSSAKVTRVQGDPILLVSDRIKVSHFDLCLNTGMFGYLNREQRKAVLEELITVTKPGGQIRVRGGTESLLGGLTGKKPDPETGLIHAVSAKGFHEWYGNRTLRTQDLTSSQRALKKPVYHFLDLGTSRSDGKHVVINEASKEDLLVLDVLK